MATTRRDRDSREPVIRKQRNFAAWIIGMFIILLIALVALMWLGFLDLGLFEEETAGPDEAITVNEIMDDPEAFYGDIVTVSDEVGEVLGPRAMTIGGSELIDEDALLILINEGTEIPDDFGEDASALEGSEIQVTGVVGEFNIQEIDDLGDFVYDEERFQEFDNSTVIQAERIELVSEVSE